MSKIRILIADDHTIVRKGLCTLLESYDGFEVVGEARNGIEAVEKTKNLLPDIVLMDITMPGLNGVEATRQIKKRFPKVKVVVLTMHSDKNYIRQTLQAGAISYLNKDLAEADLIASLQAAYHNKPFLTPTISTLLLDYFTNHAKKEARPNKSNLLSPKERAILQLIAESCCNKEIARRLSTNINTVCKHRSNIMRKLDIHDILGLTKYAIKNGLISSH